MSTRPHIARNIYLVILSALILTSCDNSLFSSKPEQLDLNRDFEIHKVQNDYRIRIPKYFEQTEDLNDEATIQFQNLNRDVYVLVLDEPKDAVEWSFLLDGEMDTTRSLLENYRAFQISSMFPEEYSESNPPLIKDLSIPSCSEAESVYCTSDEVVNGLSVAYDFCFIEGPENLYMVMCWTSESKYSKYKNTFQQIFQSFRILPNKAKNENNLSNL